ncbi:MAG: C40 family peptidase, partial [Bacteroidia bacterium]|nr:C40 family peptidase [Bacteroidia bacterium]
MLKQILLGIASILLLASCSGLKQLNMSNNKPVAIATPSVPVKFIDDITAETAVMKTEVKASKKEKEIAKAEPKKHIDVIESRISESNVSALQLKYADILETEPDQLQNNVLLESIDDWYGTRYRYGGTTRNGIDCSAFVDTIFAVVFGVTLPRTARDQYKVTRRISRTELEEGDLLFFNTRGGVSHVGIYLQNNKFVHASSTYGVTVSDMFEPYYIQ